MKRRSFVALTAETVLWSTGCLSGPNRQTGSESTHSDTKLGSVDNHRITAVEALSHDAIRRDDNGDHRWVVTVKLRLKPMYPKEVTPYPIGVFFLFFGDEGNQLLERFEVVKANTGRTPRTVAVEAEFEPTDAAAESFASYRIDLVHT